MNPVAITGWGAVSPAGWNVGALRQAIDFPSLTTLSLREIPRGGHAPLRIRDLPPRPAPAPHARHPRFRRASQISLSAADAVLEALASPVAGGTVAPGPLGLIVCLQCGCVDYSVRFFQEVQENPASASPLLFPETVANAPASHLAAWLDRPVVPVTLVGDAATFLTGLALGARWLLDGTVAECLVVGVEETDAVIAEALACFDPTLPVASGAGALRLTPDPAGAHPVHLECVTDPMTYTRRLPRSTAPRRMRAQLPPGDHRSLLVDSRAGNPRRDAPEAAAWADWRGRVLSPKTILGEGFSAGAAWQSILACAAIRDGTHDLACVSVTGFNQQATGAAFRVPERSSPRIRLTSAAARSL